MLSSFTQQLKPKFVVVGFRDGQLRTFIIPGNTERTVVYRLRLQGYSFADDSDPRQNGYTKVERRNEGHVLPHGN